jgi:hypothetical protein
MCTWLGSHRTVEEAGFYESRSGSPYDIGPKAKSRDVYRQCITPLGAPLPRWASGGRGGGGAGDALSPSVAFVVAGKAKASAAAPGGANELDVNFDPHTGVIASAFWLRGSPLGRITPLPPRANGFVLTTMDGSSVAPLTPPAGATGIHVEWEPVTGRLVKASWFRVGNLLADIPLAVGQSALAVGA